MNSIDYFWLGFGIAVATCVLLTGAVVGTIALLRKYAPVWWKYIYEMFGNVPKFDGIGYLTTWLSLTPYFFFFGGFISDILMGEYQYSKASLVGLITIILVSLIGSNTFASYTEFTSNIWVFWIMLLVGGGLIISSLTIGLLRIIPDSAFGTLLGAGIFVISAVLAGNGYLGNEMEYATKNTSYGDIHIDDICATPGLYGLQTTFAPVGILLTSTILWCHMLESIDAGAPDSQAATGITIAATFAAEYAILWWKGCFDNFRYGWLSPILSELIAFYVGTIAYYSMKRSSQEPFTSSGTGKGVFHPPEPPPSKKTAKSSSNETKVIVGQTPAVEEDSDQFVCEAYKDGELVTSTLVD